MRQRDVDDDPRDRLLRRGLLRPFAFAPGFGGFRAREGAAFGEGGFSGSSQRAAGSELLTP